MKLTPKQHAFADFYITLGNAAEAAIKAGYSKKYAAQNTDKLLKNTNIKTYIAQRMEEIKSARIADQQEIMEFLTSVMRGEVDEPIPILNGDGYQKIVNVKPSAQARKSAAELLGKRYTMWTDKQQLEGNIGVTIVDDLDD